MVKCLILVLFPSMFCMQKWFCFFCGPILKFQYWTNSTAIIDFNFTRTNFKSWIGQGLLKPSLQAHVGFTHWKFGFFVTLSIFCLHTYISSKNYFSSSKSGICLTCLSSLEHWTITRVSSVITKARQAMDAITTAL